MTAPLLQLDRVAGGYGGTQVLHDASLHVRHGEIVALLGANGAGKTSLLNAIVGLLPVRGGDIRYDGEPLGRKTEHIVRLGISLVPERRQLFGTMTVEENLKLGAYTQARRAKIDRLLDEQYARFPILAERRRQLAQTMSGGQQQMLALARALMSSPTLLLLDEPSLGLAPIIVQQMFDTIAEISASGRTILLVEQNARAALKIATRAYVMETGRIGAECDPKVLLSDNSIAKAYLGGGDENSMENRIRRKAESYPAFS